MQDVGERIVTVKFAKELVENFCKRPSPFGQIKFEVSAPWHFNESKGAGIPFAKENGIYIYTKPNKPSWNISADENSNELLYVGKSVGDISGRVWHHVGRTCDPTTNLPSSPRFKFHRWSTALSVPSEVRESVATGNVVIYTISLHSESRNYILPELLEKYVLVEYVLAMGRLPALNLQL